MPAFLNLEELTRLATERTRTEVNLLPELPKEPESVTATGLKFGFRIQWPLVSGVSGYRIAMTATNNLESPEALSPLLWGVETQSYEWFYGDTTLTRQFTVQSFKLSVAGEIFYSDFTRPLSSATSKADGGAADSAPGSVATTPSPPTEGRPGAPGGVEGPL